LSRALEERTDEIGGADEEHAAAESGGLHTEGDGEMGLSGADGTGEDDVFGTTDPLAVGELGDLGRAHPVGRGEVEAVESLGLRETGSPQPLSHGGFPPRGFLGGKHLVEVILVTPVLLTGLAGQRFVDTGQSRHLEDAGLGGDHFLGERRIHGCSPPSHAS
jgi:hypothetical protein